MFGYRSSRRRTVLILILMFLLALFNVFSCGGGGGGSQPVPSGQQNSPPAMPTDFSLVENEGAITLSWNEAEGALQYHLYWTDDGAESGRMTTVIDNMPYSCLAGAKSLTRPFEGRAA